MDPLKDSDDSNGFRGIKYLGVKIAWDLENIAVVLEVVLDVL